MDEPLPSTSLEWFRMAIGPGSESEVQIPQLNRDAYTLSLFVTLLYEKEGTFMEIMKKKSSENYKGVPYITTLLSTSLWTFYGLLDPDDGVLIVTVNAVGVTSQAAYIVLSLFYAPKERKVKYFGLVLLDMVFLGIVIATTSHFMEVQDRMVVRTRVLVWFAFAMLLKDYYILVPNAVGIVLGSLQLIVYFMYNNKTSSSEFIDKLGDLEKSAQKAKGILQTNDLEQGQNLQHKSPSIKGYCLVGVTSLHNWA
ncbi:Multitransmembrane protein [Handroanthus impetiginosus]|uniref:Bidirectional sugar transporter SWEET n=1 Tax=Handroanthus impetiginosus TaxID=429701 RepID=A0A2G9GK27_9LAMI|nr:Multitransmembrane protein [Handroanthus impetiginosus]